MVRCSVLRRFSRTNTHTAQTRKQNATHLFVRSSCRAAAAAAAEAWGGAHFDYVGMPTTRKGYQRGRAIGETKLKVCTIHREGHDYTWSKGGQTIRKRCNGRLVNRDPPCRCHAITSSLPQRFGASSADGIGVEGFLSHLNNSEPHECHFPSKLTKDTRKCLLSGVKWRLLTTTLFATIQILFRCSPKKEPRDKVQGCTKTTGAPPPP